MLLSSSLRANLIFSVCAWFNYWFVIGVHTEFRECRLHISCHHTKSGKSVSLFILLFWSSEFWWAEVPRRLRPVSSEHRRYPSVVSKQHQDTRLGFFLALNERLWVFMVSLYRRGAILQALFKCRVTSVWTHTEKSALPKFYHMHFTLLLNNFGLERKFRWFLKDDN